MNEEALKDAYGLFVNTGYNGTIEDFTGLINTNPEALKDAHGLFVETGYNGGIDDFSVLLGVKKKEPSSTQSPESGDGASVDSQSQSLSPSEGKKTFLGFDIEAAKAQYNTLSPTKKRIVDLTIEKAQLEKKVRINPWGNDVLRLDEVGKQIERLSAVAQTDEYLASNNVNLAELADTQVRTEAMRQVVEGGGVAPVITPEQEAARSVKAAKELMVVDLYMNHLKQADPARYNEEVELLPRYKDAVTATGNQGLIEWVNKNKPAEEGVGAVGFIAKSSLALIGAGSLIGDVIGETYEPYTRNDAEARAFRIVNEADAFFNNYLNQKAIEVVEAQDALPEDAKIALKGIGDTTIKLNDIRAKITTLQEQNPKVFGATRRASIEALEAMQSNLAAKKAQVEEAFTKLQANDANMALSEKYTALAQEYNAMVEEYNVAADNAKVSGESAIIGEYNSLIEDYKALSANVDEAMGKVGAEFWASVEAYNKLEGIAEQHAKDVMDKPFDWSAWRESMKQRELLQREIDVMAGIARGDLGAYVNEVIVRPILEPILETSKGVLVGVPNTVADLVMGEDRGSDALNRLYNGIENAPNSVNMLPVLKEAGLFGNERVPAWMSAPAAISQGFGSVAVFATGGGVAAGTARAAGATAKAVNMAQKVAVASTATAMMTDGLYREALSAGIPRREAAAISLAMAGILGYTETLVNDADLFAPVSSRFRQSVFQELAQNYATGKGFTRGMLSKQMTNVLKGLDEFGEEATAAIVEGVLKGAVNLSYGEDYFELPDATDILEQGLIGAFTGFGAGAIGQLASSAHPSNINTFIEVVNDPARLNDALDYLRPRLTNEQFAEFNSLVTAYQGVFTGVDVEGLSDDVKAQVADGLVRIGLMEQEIKEARDKDIAEQMMRPKIEALRGQVMGLLGEREATIEEIAPVEVDTVADGGAFSTVKDVAQALNVISPTMSEQEFDDLYALLPDLGDTDTREIIDEAIDVGVSALTYRVSLEYQKAKSYGSNPELIQAVDKLLGIESTPVEVDAIEQQGMETGVQEPIDNQTEVISSALESVEPQEDQLFTDGERLNNITESARLKYGVKIANPIIDVALRLVNPNQNNIVEIRTNGVVVKEGEDFFFKPFNNTDSAKKNWGLGSSINVNDQYQWRILFNKESDVFKKSAMLRSLSDVSKSEKELSDILNLLTDDIPEQANIAWSIMNNPNSSRETFERAAKNEFLASSTNESTINSLRENRFGFRDDIKDAVNKFDISDINALSEKSNPLFTISEQELSDLYDADPDEISIEQNAQRIELRRLARKPSTLVIPDLLAKFKSIPKEQRTENWDVVFGARKNSILEAYYKAKQDGSNPELVQAVENLIQSSETTPTQPVTREQGGQAQSAVTEEARPTPQERGVDGAETATTEGTATGDTAVTGSVEDARRKTLERVRANIQQLDQFGKETLGMNMPVVVGKAILKVAEAVLENGGTVAQAIDAALEKLRSYKWFQNRTAEQQAKAEMMVNDFFTEGEPIRVSQTPAQRKRFKDLRKRITTELNKGLASSDVFERMGLDRLSQAAMSVVNNIDGAFIDDFMNRVDVLMAAREDMPLENYAESMTSLMDEFFQEYNIVANEMLGSDTDSENVKKAKYISTVELAALEIEEAVAQIKEKYGDVRGLADAIKAAYADDEIWAGNNAYRESGLRTIDDMLTAYVADALSILDGLDPNVILQAAEKVYGYTFKDSLGIQFSSTRIARELADSAVILQALANGEKLPSNLQALQTTTALVYVAQNITDLTDNYSEAKQREGLAWLMGSIANANSPAAQADYIRAYGDWTKGRSARVSAISKGLRYLFDNVMAADSGRVKANEYFSGVRTELNDLWSRIKYQPNAKKPSGVSANIARKLDLGKGKALQGAVQMNGVTQEIASVLAGIFMFERQLQTNPDKIIAKGGEMQAVIDSWMRHNQALAGENPYSVRLPWLSIDDDLGRRNSEEFYRPVYTWLLENGYYEEGVLDYAKLFEDMNEAEREFVSYMVRHHESMAMPVAMFNNAARNEDLPVWDSFFSLQTGVVGGGSSASNMNITPEEEMRAFTTPVNSDGVTFEVESQERPMGMPTRPSSSHPRASSTFNRPIVLSAVSNFGTYIRQQYRDYYITPSAQRALRMFAFTAAMTQNEDKKVHNLAFKDSRIAAMFTSEVFNQKAEVDSLEDKRYKRMFDAFAKELNTFVMSSFLTGGLMLKFIPETVGMLIASTSKYGHRLALGFYDNNISKDAKLNEAFIIEAGLGITGALGSESANLSYSVAQRRKKRGINDFKSGSSRFGAKGYLLSAINSVESKAGMRNFFNALWKGIGAAWVRRKFIGLTSALLSFPEAVVSPSITMAVVRDVHKKETGRDFDVREYIDEETGAMRVLTGEQRRVLEKIKLAADRGVGEFAVEPDPAGQARITRMVGEGVFSKMVKKTLFPLMSWPYNNTVEFLRSLSNVVTLGSYKYQDRENIVFGADLGEGRAATFVSGLSDATARTIAGVAYYLGMNYINGMVYAVISKVFEDVFPEVPDEDYDELKEIMEREHNLQVDNSFKALPNVVVRSLLDNAYNGLPISAMMPLGDMINNELALAPVEFTEEEAQHNRLLRIYQGRRFKELEEGEEMGYGDFIAGMSKAVSPETMGQRMAGAPIWDFLTIGEQIRLYMTADEAMKEVWEMSDIPTGVRYATISSIAGFMLKCPLMTTYKRQELENIRKGNERMKQIMKSNEYKQVVKEVERKVSGETKEVESK